MPKFSLSSPGVYVLLALLAVAWPLPAAEPADGDWREALCFHAPFDDSADAAFGRGDLRIYTSASLEDRRPERGLKADGVSLAPGQGRFGGALRFSEKAPQAVMFQAAENMPYRGQSWSGTVSLWLSLDPQRDLAPGFADPIQITERGWNDGALFVDFSKDDVPRHFRLGAFADRQVWDPRRREWDDVPVAERPMVDVARPPFGHGRWTHVAFTFENFNTGRDDGLATLYLDGRPQGSLSGRRQTITWDPAKSAILLGLSYIGLMDDLAIFDRALSAEEIRKLHALPAGIKGLRAPR